MNKNLRHVALLAILLLELTACAGNAPRTGKEAEQPISLQPATGTDRRAKVHTELGGMYLGDGRFATALEEARSAIDADPNYAPAYNLLGLVHMYLHENALAEQNFDRALRLAPGDPEINNNFGWFLCQADQPKRSIAYFQAAIANPLYETPAKPLVNAGVCSLKLQDDAAAEGYLTKALRIDNANGTALYWLADIQYRHNHLSEAQSRIDALHHNTEPNAASAWLALRIARKLGDRDEESRYFGLLRRKFADSQEYRKLSRGQFE
jgi:type IV pilus assembly protein PilF